MKKLFLLLPFLSFYVCSNDAPFIRIKNRNNVTCTYPIELPRNNQFAEVILQGYGRGYIFLNICNQHQIVTNSLLPLMTMRNGALRIKTQRKDWTITLQVPIHDRTKNISFLVFR